MKQNKTTHSAKTEAPFLWTDTPLRRRLETLLLTLFFLIYVTAAVVVLVPAGAISMTRQFLLPNAACAAVGLAAVAGILWLTRNRTGERSLFDIRIATAVLFAVELLILYNAYFRTGWDVELVTRQAQLLSSGQVDAMDTWYYSFYPNNLLITMVLSLFFRLQNAGLWPDAVFAAAVVQCVLLSLSGWLLYDVLVRFRLRHGIAILGWWIYACWVGISPWLLIVYTDASGVIFPIAMIALFQRTENGSRLCAKWCGIALLGFWGFRLKPQAAVACIAVVIVAALYHLYRHRADERRRLGAIVLAAVVCLGCSAVVWKGCVAATGLRLDEQKSFGTLHMVMMGLNPNTHGTWAQEDVDTSATHYPKSERTQAQLAVIRQRLEDYGADGLLRHLRIKTRINFNDGAFCWGVEGNFYPPDTVYDPPNDTLSPFLRSVFYSTGDDFPILGTCWQVIWMAVLMLGLAAPFRRRERTATAIALALVGIAVFLTVFECRTRYLLTSAPLLIAQACLGMQVLWDRISPHLEKKGSVSE